MESVYMNNDEMTQYKEELEAKLNKYTGVNSEFKKWFITLPENAKNDFLYNFFSIKSAEECIEIFKYCFSAFKMDVANLDIFTRRVIYHEDLNVMFDIGYNYKGGNGLKQRHIVSIADAICQTTSMKHVFPFFELLSKDTIYLPGFYAILKSRDMSYINLLVDKLAEKPYIVRQDELEKLVDTLLKIDDSYTIDTLYRVANDILETDISRCIKDENIKYILEKSNRFFKLGKKKDLENIVLKSKNVHEIINLVHRESLAKEQIDYNRVINSIITNNIFDCEDNVNILGHVMGMMKNYKFPVSSYRILEKYLLVIHMELMPEYVSLNKKTNYKYIMEEMIHKHATEEQIQEFKENIKKNNNLFRKIIDVLTYNNYKSK